MKDYKGEELDSGRGNTLKMSLRGEGGCAPLIWIRPLAKRSVLPLLLLLQYPTSSIGGDVLCSSKKKRVYNSSKLTKT